MYTGSGMPIIPRYPFSCYFIIDIWFIYRAPCFVHRVRPYRDYRSKHQWKTRADCPQFHFRNSILVNSTDSYFSPPFSHVKYLDGFRGMRGSKRESRYSAFADPFALRGRGCSFSSASAFACLRFSYSLVSIYPLLDTNSDYI